jgi:hypothetical protein
MSKAFFWRRYGIAYASPFLDNIGVLKLFFVHLIYVYTDFGRVMIGMRGYLRALLRGVLGRGKAVCRIMGVWDV